MFSGFKNKLIDRQQIMVNYSVFIFFIVILIALNYLRGAVRYMLRYCKCHESFPPFCSAYKVLDKQ